MRIVFLSYNYSPDIHSPQEWVQRLQYYVGWLECLAKEHTVIRVDQVNYEGEFNHNGVHYYCINNGQRKNYFPSKLHHFVQTLKPDIVIVSSFCFPLQVMQLRKRLGKNVKIILQHHAEKPFTGIKKYLQRLAAFKTDIFLFTAYSTGIDWVQKANLDTGIKIHELMEVSSVFYPMGKEPAGKKTQVSGSPIYLWVGRLNQNKDPLLAVNAFLKFAALHPRARLYMIYQQDDLLPAIKQRLDNNPAAAAIVLVGKIPHDDLLYWYNSADFYLSASHYEGSGTALCEAMSCGCIPVVTDIPSFRTINNNCGILYEPGDEKALLHALQQSTLLNINEKKKQALEHFKNNLSFDAIAGKFQQIIASL
jgi:glycosyltransferase involved in cell wall biosynthesis